METFHTPRKQLSNEQGDELTVTGEVFSGLGEAAKYISMEGYMKQFKSKLGFSPYPGTLNLKLLSDNDLKVRKLLITGGGIYIDGFSDGNQTLVLQNLSGRKSKKRKNPQFSTSRELIMMKQSWKLFLL